MTRLQAILLEMATEIEEICHNNGIDYYLSGGSVIGALRHKGFVPWDDDIDILMTRDNWKKFLNACKTQLPPDRKLECIELNENFNNTINRYINTKTLNVHKNELLGDTNAGIVIDIILMDPIPNDENCYRSYLKDIVLFSDLINLPYMYLLRWEYKLPYRLYLWLMKVVTRKRVSAFFERRFTKYADEECDKYIVAWGGGPTLFEKSMFGKPRYVEFEGKQLPVPEKAYEFIRILYGYDVMNVPRIVDQTSHDTLINYERSYEEFADRFKKTGWDEEKVIQEAYLPHKLLAVKWAPRQNRDSHRTALIEAYKVKAVLENTIRQNGLDLAEMLRRGEYDTLRKLFGEYIAKQSSRQYIGGEMWAQLTRRHDPVFIDISDELLGYVLYTLMYDGELEKMERILRAREMVKKEPLAYGAAAARKFLLQMREAINLYYARDYEQSLSTLEAIDKEYPDLAIVAKLKIRIYNFGLHREQEKSDELVLREVARFPEDGEFLKYQADLMYRKEGIGASWRLYKKAYDRTRHGIFWSEIYDVLASETDWMYRRALELRSQGGRKELQKLIDAWGIVPDIITADTRYQEVYFEQRIYKCRSDADRKHLRAKVLAIWDDTADKTVLINVYGQCLEALGKDAAYVEERIVLDKRSTDQELRETYKELTQMLDTDDSEQLRFLRGKAAYRAGKYAEAFKEYRRLVMEDSAIREPYQIIANDILHQLIRMDRINNAASRKYFAKEWRIKYPDPKETARLLVKVGLCSEMWMDKAAYVIGIITGNKLHYTQSVRKLLWLLCLPEFPENGG